MHHGLERQGATLLGFIMVAWPIYLAMGTCFRCLPSLLFVVLICKGGDIGGYCFGRLFGRRKLIPHISPGKTVEGALSGIAAENLEGGSGIASRTIASLEHQWTKDRELLDARDVLVIAEAIVDVTPFDLVLDAPENDQPGAGRAALARVSLAACELSRNETRAPKGAAKSRASSWPTQLAWSVHTPDDGGACAVNMSG